MPKSAQLKKSDEMMGAGLASRLELIKKRHHALIIGPRERLAATSDDDFEDSSDEVLDADQMELAGALGLGRF